MVFTVPSIYRTQLHPFDAVLLMLILILFLPSFSFFISRRSLLCVFVSALSRVMFRRSDRTEDKREGFKPDDEVTPQGKTAEQKSKDKHRSGTRAVTAISIYL